jgi:hypothetical protein
MAPKAKGKAKAKAKAHQPRRQISRRDVYAPRGNPDMLMQWTAARRADMEARPGRWCECTRCGLGKRMPDDVAAARVVRCSMPRVDVGDGGYVQCSVATTASAWRSRPLDAAVAQARAAALPGIVTAIEAQIQNGEIDDDTFWSTLRGRLRQVVVPAEGDGAGAMPVAPLPA